MPCGERIRRGAFFISHRDDIDKKKFKATLKLVGNEKLKRLPIKQ